MTFRILLAALFAIGLPATPLLAQDQSVKDIVVTGRKETRKQAVRKLSSAISVMTQGQMARFSDLVCPQVEGFDPPYNDTVAIRIAADAAAAGLVVDKPGCHPNVTIVMVDDGRAVLNALYKQTPELFRDIPTIDRQRLLGVRGPVRVLTITELRSGGGKPLQSGPRTGVSLLYVQSASIIDPATRQDINGALVLIDRSAAMGKTLTQIADYAAMRALARLNGSEVKTSEPTILTLFDADATAPRMLSAFDSGYLKALYKGSGDRLGNGKMGDIIRSIDRAPASPDQSAPPPREGER